MMKLNLFQRRLFLYDVQQDWYLSSTYIVVSADLINVPDVVML